MNDSNSQIQTVLEFAPIGVIQSDSTGACIYANRKWLEITGATLEETLGQGWINCLYPDDLSRVLESWTCDSQTCEVDAMEFRIRRPSGEVRFLKVSALVDQAHFNADAGPIRFVDDVTESRRGDAARMALSPILEQCLNEIYIVDAETFRFEFVNECARRNLGYSLDSLRQMTPVDVNPGFDLPGLKKLLAPLRNHETDLMQLRSTHRRADGTTYNVEVHLQMSMSKDRPVFLAIMLDISDRIALESQVFASTELHRAIVDDAAFAIIATSPTGTITRFNSAAERLLGYSASELIHKHTPSIFHLEEEVASRAREFSAELGVALIPGFDVIVAKSRHDIHNEHEWKYVRKDGSHVSVMLGVSVLRDESNTVTGYVGIAKDISRRKAAEEALRVTKERLDLAVRGSSDGFWDWNLETAEVDFSPKLHELLGFSNSDARIRRQDYFLGLIHPEDKGLYKKAVDAHLEKNRDFETITRVRTKQGEWRWFRIRGEAVEHRQGAPTRMAGSMSDITSQKTAEEKFALAAVTDQLTGLYNRAGFVKRMSGVISRAAATDSKFAVMYLDFDRFKAINDKWGHETGDELLRQIAHRLRYKIPENGAMDVKASTIARLGGDEFVVLVERLESSEEAIRLIQELQETLNQPYQLGKHLTSSTASIGIVIGPSSYSRSEDILQDADMAMYEAKQAGRARFSVFDSEMRRRASRRIQLEHDLSDAIGTSQLELQYQPVVSLLTGEINSVEVSLSWQHPGYGTVDPSEFMPIALSSNLILRLNEWVLRESCRQCQLWRLTMGTAAPPQVSVNLPRKHFTAPGFLDLLRQILTETGLPPNRLLLEISQECFTVDTDEAIQTMNAIRGLGIELAIDDFGVGTASFVTLHQFPVSLLKLDRSLIGKIDNSKCEAAMLHGLVVMARNLNVKLVAEGVELRCQQKAVLELGCEFMQGSFAANPMPVEELENYLSHSRFSTSLAVGAMAFAGGWSERMAFIEPPAQ